MTKLFSLLIAASAFLFLSPLQAQEKAKWKELETFHEVMAQTFHPSEEGKLEPIRTRSQEVVDKAIAWKNSKAPKGYDKAAVNASLAKLVAGAKEINKMVKAHAADADIKSKLSALHDVFHQI